MNSFSNSPTLTASQEVKAAFDWGALRQETSHERAVRTQGHKRYADGLSPGASDDRIKRTRLNQGSPSFTLPAMTRNTRPNTTRSPLVSSSRLPRMPFIEEEGDMKPIIPKPTPSSRPKANGPFVYLSDNESDEDAVPIVDTKPLPQPPQKRFDFNPNQANLSQQRILSEQKRAEAKRRKEESYGLSSTFDRSDVPSVFNVKHERHTAGISHGFVSHRGNGDGLKNSPSMDESSTLRRSTQTGPPGTSSFAPRLPVINRHPSTPSHLQGARSKVVDLTDDASDDVFPKAAQTSHTRHYGQHEHQDWLARYQERDTLQEAQATAQERAEREKQASEEKEAERQERALEEDRKKRLVEEKRKEHQRQLAEEADRNKKPEEKYDWTGQQQENNRRLLPEEERRPQLQAQLRQHNEWQEALRREKARRDERALEDQRELDRELAEKREMDERMAEFHQAKADAEKEEAEREEAEKRNMAARMADFKKRKAEAERRQAETKRLEDQRRQQEETQTRLERETLKEQAARSFTDREREEERRRQERIQKQQRRNALNREHDDDDDDDSDTDEPLAHQRRDGQPISLSDLARRSERHQTLPRRAAPPFRPSAPSTRTGCLSDPSDPSTHDEKSQRIKFAEITEDHGKLMYWRSPHWNLDWDRVQVNFDKRLGKKRSKDHLRARYRELLQLFQKAKIDEDTLEELYKGNHDALARVNRLVDRFRFTPLYPETKQERKEQEAAAAQKIKTQTQTQTPEPFASLVPKAKPRSANTFGTFTGGGVRTALKVPPTAVTSDLDPAPVLDLLPERPTTGGKTMDQNFWVYHFRILQQNLEEREQEAEDAQAPHNLGDDPTDFIYNVYRVYRREWSLDDIERCEYEGEEEPEWWECPGEFEDVGKANSAAAKEVMRTLPGRPVYTEFGAMLKWENGEDGMAEYTLENEAVGIVEVHVARQLRTYEERILPKTDLHKKSRTMYIVKQRIVKQRIVKKATDDVLGSSELQDHESILPDGLTTSRDQANHIAATHFVNRTFKSDSANLHLRDAEKYEETTRILDNLPQLALVHLKTDKDDGDVTEVWVEVNQHQGPVN